LRRVVALGPEVAARGIESWDALLASATDVPEDLVRAIAAEVTPYDEALIIYTSGTTDRPKGIVHAHRAPVIQSWRFAELMGLGPDDRVWTAQPFFWTAGVAMSLGATWAAGGCLLVQESFEPEAAIDLIARERATAVHAWPHQEKAMAEHPEAVRRDLTSVRRIEFGSPLARVVGIERDEWGMYASYGLSETFTLASALPASAPAAQRATSSGRPLPGIALRIVDPATGRELAVEEFGEIAVRGLTMMRGYYKVEPELYMAEDGFFRTGDSGRVDRGGELHWTGRLSTLIKTGGANVSPLEIESALGGHPGVKASCVVGVPHPTLGEAVVLCVIPTAGATPDLDAIRADLRGKLASYKMPRALLVFADHEVQYTGNQKIQPGPLRAAALVRLEREGVTIDGHCYGR
jgi:fatty-acyl-CoA synthase